MNKIDIWIKMKYVYYGIYEIFVKYRDIDN